MSKPAIALAAFLLASCATPSAEGHFGPAPEAGAVQCRVTEPNPSAPHGQCPSAADFVEAEEIFRSVFPEAPPLTTVRGGVIRVEWWPSGKNLTSYWRKEEEHIHGAHGYTGGRVVGHGPDLDIRVDQDMWIECESWGGWPHERIHLLDVQLGRRADYHPPPLNEWVIDPSYNAKEERLKMLLRARFGAR